MKKLSWKPALYVAIGAIAGSTIMAAPAAMAGQNFKYYWAKFSQNGQQNGQAQAIMYGGTNYFGIWYLQQLLKKDGIDVTWNGSELSLSGVPTQQPTTLSISGTTQPSTSPLLTNAITVNGVTYVPLSTVQAMLAHAGVRLNEGDQKDQSGISAGNIQSIISHLQDAEKSLTQYVQASNQLQTMIGKNRHFDQGDLQDAFHHLTDAMAKLQSAYSTLTELQTMLSSSSSPTSSGTTTVTSSVYGNNSSTLATQLGTITTALEQDLQVLNGIAMSSVTGSTTTSTGGSTSTGSTSSSTTTSSSSSTTTSTSSSTTGPTDLTGVMNDLVTQVGQLSQIEAQLRANGSGGFSQDN